MKRFSKILMVVILSVSFLTGCSPQTPTSPPIAIKIFTAASYPPFEFVDYAKRQITGFDIDLMNAIGAAANLKVEFVNTGYDQVLSAIAHCQAAAAISAIPITDDLKQQMNFTNPYFALGQVVVVQKGNSTITSKDKLSGMTVGAQEKTSSVSEAGKITGIKLKTYAVYTIALNDLIYGIIDAVITDKLTALSYVNQAENNLKIVGNEFGMENYGIAVCGTMPDQLKTINNGLAAVKSNGTLGRLVKKWLANPVINNQ